MTPTIVGADSGAVAEEPGGRRCNGCKEMLEPGDDVYRETFGAVDRTTDSGVVFATTGGVVVRHWHGRCYRRRRMRVPAADYDVTDGDRLWNILEAADGELVADLLPLLFGGRAWLRVVDGAVEARTASAAVTDDGVRVSTAPDEDFDRADFDHYFADPGERTRVLLRPVAETPFADGHGDDGDDDGGAGDARSGRPAGSPDAARGPDPDGPTMRVGERHCLAAVEAHHPDSIDCITVQVDGADDLGRRHRVDEPVAGTYALVHLPPDVRPPDTEGSA